MTANNPGDSTPVEQAVQTILQWTGVASGTIDAQARELAQLRMTAEEYAEHMRTAHAPPEEPAARRLLSFQTFPHRRDLTGYAEHGKVLDALGWLGAGRIRGQLTPDTPARAIEFYREAFERHGCKSWMTIGTPRQALSEAEWTRILEVLTGPLDGTVDLVAGWNEPDHIRGKGPAPAGWERLTGAHQVGLWENVHPLGIRVATPQLWSGDFDVHDANLRKLAPYLEGAYDAIAWHLYPRATVGTHLVDRFAAIYFDLLGAYPAYCTEAGYSTGGSAGRPVTLQQQADLWVLHAGLYLSRGWGVNCFELLDDSGKQAGTREGELGILEPDFTPKPAAHALRELIAAA